MVYCVLNNVLLEHGGLPFVFPLRSTLTLDTIARKAMMLKLVALSLVACYLNRLQPLENIFADS